MLSGHEFSATGFGTARRVLENLRALWGVNARGRLEVSGLADLSPAAL